MKQFKTAEEIYENKELMDALHEVTNIGELAAVFERFGIQLKEGLNLEKAYEQFLTGKECGGELSEDELENVSGGMEFVIFAIMIILALTWR